MKVKAAVRYEAHKPFVIEELDIDEPRADEVRVKIAGAGICHTDLGSAENRPPGPCVFGHEGSGIVEKVGSAVTKVAPGDHVVLTFNNCGHCRPCLQGRPPYCLNFGPMNMSGGRPDGSATLTKNGEPVWAGYFGQSSWASYALANQRNVIKVAQDVPIEMLGPLGCGFQTGSGAVINSLAVRPGSSVAVFGVGAVGLAAIMGAGIAGATQIIAVDIVPARLEMARVLGATHLVNSKEVDPVATIREITGGGSDYTVESSGIPTVLGQAFLAIARGGGVCGFITAGRADVPINTSELLAGRTMRGIMEGDSVPDLFIPKLVEHYKQGRFPIDRLVKYYALEDFNQAVEDSLQGRTVKSVIRF